ncbi:hypothetical protein F2P79_009740, partial [Pimephales promelas]
MATDVDNWVGYARYACSTACCAVYVETALMKFGMNTATQLKALCLHQLSMSANQTTGEFHKCTCSSPPQNGSSNRRAVTVA